jgi:hypothetical protein
MSIPEVTCSADVLLEYNVGSRLVSLGATATNSPDSYEWTILSVPDGSTADTGVKGDFTDGVSTLQYPDLEIDGAVDGTYVIQCIAKKTGGNSNPFKDLENGQQCIVVGSARYGNHYPGKDQYAYHPYLDSTLRKYEELHKTTHQNGGDDELDVTDLSGVLADPQTPASHSSDHEDGGSDEISLTGLSGEAATPQTPKTHASTHASGQSDQINVGGLPGELADPQPPKTHATDHQDSGSDEINVGGLSGELADPQIPKAHVAEHENGGTDELSVAGLSGLLATAQTPIAHKSTHDSGGTDELTLQLLGSGAATSGKIVETNGSGGWNLIDTPTGGGGGGTPNLVEEGFQTAGTETPGDIVSFSLSKSPSGGGTADTPSGYHILVYTCGKKMGYKSPAPTTVDEYYYNSTTNEVDIYASGQADDYEVVMIDSLSTAIIPHAEEFQTAGTETLGDIVSFALTSTPRGDGTADTPSGYDLHVYYDGIKMKYKSPAPTDVNEYYYDSANNEVDIYATGDVNDFEIVYGE